MILKILTDKENKLLDRKEMEAEIEFSGKTPSNNELKKELVDKLKTDENLIVINHIYQKFGDQKAKVIAKIYKSKESLDKFNKVKIAKVKKEVKEEKK